jgi:hypothetical protein
MSQVADKLVDVVTRLEVSLSLGVLVAAGAVLIWVHARGQGRRFWSGLAVLGLLYAGGGLMFAWRTGSGDANAVLSWLDQSQWLAAAIVMCAAVAVSLPHRDGQELRTSVAETFAAGPTVEAGATSVERRLAVGLAGEQLVRERFLETLPHGTWVLNNLRLPTLMGDIDLVVVGANGVFVPEVKTWSGCISCSPDGRVWSRIRAGWWEQLPDPVAQAQGQVRGLRRYLEAIDSDLCQQTRLWIQGLVVFAHPAATLDASYSPMPALNPEQAVDAIQTTVARRQLTSAEQERIVELLAAAR